MAFSEVWRFEGRRVRPTGEFRFFYRNCYAGKISVVKSMTLVRDVATEEDCKLLLKINNIKLIENTKHTISRLKLNEQHCFIFVL